MACTAVPDSNRKGNIGMIFCVPTSHFNSKSSSWIINLGESSHIAYNLYLLILMSVNLSSKFVLLPNNQKVFVSAIGSVNLSPSLGVQNVLYIPTFSVSLISVSSLLRDKDSNSFCSSFTNSAFLV